MSYPHLSTETATACSQAAYAYSPACYCVFHWGYADYLPSPKYHGRPTKWLEVAVWRTADGEQADRYVAAVAGDNAPELLRRLHEALAVLTSGEQPDPSLVASTQAQADLSAALHHPMLGAGLLLHTLDKLLPYLPAAKAQDLTTRLRRVIDNREAQVYTPPEGRGWIASAPQTTQELKAWPTERGF